MQTGIRLFFRKQLCTQDSSRRMSTLFHIIFKFRSVPGQFNLEVTTMPGTAKFLGSNLTRTCFIEHNEDFYKEVWAIYDFFPSKVSTFVLAQIWLLL